MEFQLQSVGSSSEILDNLRHFSLWVLWSQKWEQMAVVWGEWCVCGEVGEFAIAHVKKIEFLNRQLLKLDLFVIFWLGLFKLSDEK